VTQSRRGCGGETRTSDRMQLPCHSSPIMNKIMNQQEQMRSRDGRLRLPLTDSFSCCETRKSQEVDGKSLPLHGCCPLQFHLELELFTNLTEVSTSRIKIDGKDPAHEGTKWPRP